MSTNYSSINFPFDRFICVDSELRWRHRTDGFCRRSRICIFFISLDRHHDICVSVVLHCYCVLLLQTQKRTRCCHRFGCLGDRENAVNLKLSLTVVEPTIAPAQTQDKSLACTIETRTRDASHAITVDILSWYMRATVDQTFSHRQATISYQFLLLRFDLWRQLMSSRDVRQHELHVTELCWQLSAINWFVNDAEEEKCCNRKRVKRWM